MKVLLLKIFWSICHFPSVSRLKMSFLESVLLKNLFHFICILDFRHFCCVIALLSLFFLSHFRFLSTSMFFFCWSSKKTMGQVGRDFSFQSCFSFFCLSQNFPRRNLFSWRLEYSSPRGSRACWACWAC